MDFHLAQLNIGRILAPMDSPIMADFANNLDQINSLAENSPGFIWRLKDDANNATSIQIYDDLRIIVNMSVWETIDQLYQFAYKTMHTEFLKRRREWFEKMGEMYYVLWYVPVGHLPDVAEARERLEYLREHGETPYAFSFSKRFEPPMT
jgi:Domain of unknown function (DUF3291)